MATASFDGKIGVQTIQNTNTDAQKTGAAPALDDADFFAQAGSQPQGAAFSLSQAPKWLERPVSAVFGFGGKLVKVGPADATSRASKISISTNRHGLVMIYQEANGWSHCEAEFQICTNKGDTSAGTNS